MRTLEHGIERDNARQRHWLARFRRRSIVVSKAKRMVDVSIALFARFAGNNRISDLIIYANLSPSFLAQSAGMRGISHWLGSTVAEAWSPLLGSRGLGVTEGVLFGIARRTPDLRD